MTSLASTVGALASRVTPNQRMHRTVNGGASLAVAGR
jgi:hypothetical protein